MNLEGSLYAIWCDILSRFKENYQRYDLLQREQINGFLPCVVGEESERRGEERGGREAYFCPSLGVTGFI